MKYNMMGRTGLYVSELCLGTMTFAGTGMFKNVGQVDQEGATELVKQALDSGINFIDTADVYSQGESESYLGQALKNVGVPRHDVVIATKVRGRMGPGPNNIGLTRGHIMDAVEDSLKRLQTDHIDLYQIHGYDAVTPLDETMARARQSREARPRPLHRLLQPRGMADRKDAGPVGACTVGRGSRRCRRSTRSLPAISNAKSCR